MQISLERISEEKRYQCWSETFDNAISGLIEVRAGNGFDHLEAELIAGWAKKIANAAHGVIAEKQTLPWRGSLSDFVTDVGSLLTSKDRKELIRMLSAIED